MKLNTIIDPKNEANTFGPLLLKYIKVPTEIDNMIKHFQKLHSYKYGFERFKDDKKNRDEITPRVIDSQLGINFSSATKNSINAITKVKYA